MKKEKKNSVRLIIESGLVKKDLLCQLVRWGLLPPEAVEQAGTQKISLESGWRSINDFVTALERAIDQEAKTLQETVLDDKKEKEP